MEESLALEEFIELWRGCRVVVCTGDALIMQGTLAIADLTRIHNFENEEDLFVDTVGSSTLQLVTLLNYPQPSEQYLCLGRTGSDVFGLQLSLPAELPHFDWFNMRMTLERGLARIGKKTHMSLIQPSLQEVFRQLVLEKDLNVRGIDLFEPESKMWQGRLGVQRGVVIGLSDTIAPSKMIRRSLLEYGTLRALRLRTQDSVDIPYLHSLIELNPGLQYLDIPAQEVRIFKYLGPLWSKGVSGQLQVVPRELSAENTLHRIASLVVGTSLSDSSGSIVSVGLHVVDVSRWQSQYVSGLRADQDARVLDTATLKFPSVVASLTLNLSAFTRPGLSSIQKWPTIKSLILIGVKIDDWIRVWTELGNIFGASPGLGPRLSCFDIVGTDSGVPLSRFSALSLHRLVYSSNLGEVCLENIQLQDDGDWDLIIGAFDFATLKSLSFLNSPLFNTATLVDQLKEQLSDLELIVLTSSQEEKCLTFISLPAKSVVQTQYHELDIKGINMSQTNDIWRTLTASGEFQYGLARAMIPNDPSSPRVLRSGTVYRALARPSALSHFYQFRPIADRESGLQKIKPPMRNDSISNLHQRLQYPVVTSLDVSAAERRWGKSSSGMEGTCDSDDKTSVGASADMNSLSMTDNDVALLDASSARHPSALTTFDVDIAHLTKQGLASLRNILRRSTLEHLRIICIPIGEEVWDDVFLLLKSLRPATLKSWLWSASISTNGYGSGSRAAAIRHCTAPWQTHRFCVQPCASLKLEAIGDYNR
ncbi:hypothetical protein BGZ74_011653 [Mortierella antarctica]|nr:hypothetical protein BGZ74_011653 [Mortierella antarctica]